MLQALDLRLSWRRNSGAVVFHSSLARFLEAHFFQSTTAKLLLFSTRCVRFHGCTAWGLTGSFCFVFINLTVEKTGKILIKVSHWVESTEKLYNFYVLPVDENFSFALPTGILLPNMVMDIFMIFQLLVFLSFFIYAIRYLFYKIKKCFIIELRKRYLLNFVKINLLGRFS